MRGRHAKTKQRLDWTLHWKGFGRSRRTKIETVQDTMRRFTRNTTGMVINRKPLVQPGFRNGGGGYIGIFGQRVKVVDVQKTSSRPVAICNFLHSLRFHILPTPSQLLNGFARLQIGGLAPSILCDNNKDDKGQQDRRNWGHVTWWRYNRDGGRDRVNSRKKRFKGYVWPYFIWLVKRFMLLVFISSK